MPMSLQAFDEAMRPYELPRPKRVLHVNMAVTDKRARSEALLHEMFTFIEQERIRAVEVFFQFDADANGTLDRMEFEQALGNMRLKLNDADLSLAFDALDVTNSGSVSIEEFIGKYRAFQREEQMKKQNRAEELKQKQALTSKTSVDFEMEGKSEWDKAVLRQMMAYQVKLEADPCMQDDERQLYKEEMEAALAEQNADREEAEAEAAEKVAAMEEQEAEEAEGQFAREEREALEAKEIAEKENQEAVEAMEVAQIEKREAEKAAKDAAIVLQRAKQAEENAEQESREAVAVRARMRLHVCDCRHVCECALYKCVA